MLMTNRVILVIALTVAQRWNSKGAKMERDYKPKWLQLNFNLAVMDYWMDSNGKLHYTRLTERTFPFSMDYKKDYLNFNDADTQRKLTQASATLAYSLLKELPDVLLESLKKITHY